MVEKLLRLQRLDHEIDVLRREHSVHPERLARVRNDESQKRKVVEVLTAQLETQERERRDMEGTLKLEEERLKKSKAKVGQIKKDYEFHAMQREIESTKRSNSLLEEQVIAKIDEIEKTKKAIEEATNLWRQSATELANVEGEVHAKTSEFGGILSVKEAELRSAEAGIDKPLLSKYRLIRQRRHTDVLVKVSNYACQGCFMNIPPQTVNEMMRHKTIQSCPNCHRLVYIEFEPPGPDAA